MKTIKDLKQMMAEPASKEWFKKHGSPKSKALHKTVTSLTGHKMKFMTTEHPERREHESHLKEREGRKESYHKFLKG